MNGMVCCVRSCRCSGVIHGLCISGNWSSIWHSGRQVNGRNTNRMYMLETCKGLMNSKQLISSVHVPGAPRNIRNSCSRSIPCTLLIYSSSSSPPSSAPPSAALAFFLLLRPGRPPPNGEVRAKSMCFCESRRTMNEGTLTICLPTRMCLCLMRTRA